MNKKEQDIMKKVRQGTDNLEMPEGLNPGQIEKMLEKKGQKYKISPYRAGSLAAACVVLIAGVAFYTVNQRNAGSNQGAEAAQEKEMRVSDEGQIARASDYQEVYSYLEAYKNEMEKTQSQSGAEIALYESEAVEDSARADTGAAGGTSRTSSEKTAENYSETNVRQSGVDEGDVVKTDGIYLYVLKDDRTEVSIVDTRNNALKEVRTISAEDEEWIEEIYLDAESKQLILVCSKYEDDSGVFRYSGSTEVIIYDITDPAKTEEAGKITQSGSYHSSRAAGGYLYLFSNYSVPWEYMEQMEPDKPETYVPIVDGKAVAEEDICLPLVPAGREYTVVTAVDIDRGGITDSKAILSQGGTLYVSNENIYYYETQWSGGNGLITEKEQTTIRRISYEDGHLEAESQGKVKGYIHDSFSIDEYDGYLRVVTTEGEENAVYVLNMALEKVGAIEGLAEEERVYSARLMGETGYFVTFKETDPLFSVDFSDPENPRIIGELKIPGFSDYLHPYGDGKLLGIGMDVDEGTMVTDGVKLTMFDISDPEDVKEENTYVLKNVYSTDASYDYKAVLADAGRNIIGFSGHTEGGQNYFIFRYEEGEGFVCEMEEEINGNASVAARGIYIGETLYVVNGNIIEAYSLKDFQKVGDLIL